MPAQPIELNKRLADREFLAGDYSIADRASIGGRWAMSARARTSTTFRTSGAGSRR